MTTKTWVDELARHLEGDTLEAGYETPGQLAEALDTRTVQTPALRLIDQELKALTETPDGRLIIMMPPQEGKSQRATRRFVTWALKSNPDTRVAIASYEATVARRWGRVVRDDLRDNPDLGLTVRRDLSGQAEWQLVGHDGGVFSVGIGGGLTGRPVDLMVIDDPIKDRKQADSATYRQSVWDWWTEVASTRLAPGAPVVLILTRWHEDDLAGRLLKAPDGHRWKVLRIPAQADHDPDAGETDPLGRQPGEYLESARGRTDAQWDQIKTQVGARSWQSLYQGNPSPPEGGMFKRANWSYYDTPQWLVDEHGRHFPQGFDDVIISWDMAFKDLEDSDYVVGQIWGRRGVECYLLDQIRGQYDFPETKRQVLAFWARWPHTMLHLVEDKANGTAIIASLKSVVPGIVADEPDGSKEARAAAVSPLQEARQLWLPSPTLLGPNGTPYAPWVGDLVEEAAGFPNGHNDDQVDTMSQALKRLVLIPLLDGTIVWAEDLEPDLADNVISYY